MSPAPVAAARVLELGCGDGGNLLPMAAALPDARFIGVDVASRPVAAGTGLARAAGLSNVELLVLDLVDLPESLGEFDYVIAHGVYSWVPPEVRSALLAACERHLAHQGVAYVSYNAYPGGHLRDMASEILAFHLRGVGDPEARVRGAHALMRMIVAGENPSPYASIVRDHMQRLLEHDDWLLLHDDLADVNTPVYFHEFVDHAGAHGLRFLAEADPTEDAGEIEALEALSPDIETREQYHDFLTNRMFRQTLLRRADVEVGEASAAALYVASAAVPDGDRFALTSGAALESTDPAVARAMQELSECWPQGLPLSRFAALEDTLLAAWRAGVVELRSCQPPLAARAGKRPRASAFARLQVERRAKVVSSLLHTNVALEDAGGRQVLALLDGTRDRTELCAETGASSAELEAGLTSLGRLGLIEY